MDAEAKKRAAALAACALARPGMVLGLGTGSTVQHVLEELARRQKAGERFLGVPTSHRTEQECARLGISLTTLAEHPQIDLTIDGADELDTRLNLIKGGGGALLREKVVAAASKSVAIIADDSKLVDVLGTTFAVPVETVAFAEEAVRRRLEGLGARVVKRARDGQEIRTDNGHILLDARFPSIPDAVGLERAIKMTPGVAEVGLFVGLAHRAFVAGDTGVRELRADAAPVTKRL